MGWIQSSGGVVGTNLAHVYRWTANTNGSVDLELLGLGSPLNIPGIGTDEASAAEAMRRLTQTVDPADF